jgi:hypothetical protein
VLAGEDLRQEAALLLFRAVPDHQRPEHDDAMVGSARDAMALVFLGEHDLLARGEAQASVLLRPAGAEPALLG